MDVNKWRCARCGGTFFIDEPMHGCYGGRSISAPTPSVQSIDYWLDTLSRMAWFVGRISDPDDDTYMPSPGMLEVQARVRAMLTHGVSASSHQEQPGTGRKGEA